MKTKIAIIVIMISYTVVAINTELRVKKSSDNRAERQAKICERCRKTEHRSTFFRRIYGDECGYIGCKYHGSAYALDKPERYDHAYALRKRAKKTADGKYADAG